MKRSLVQALLVYIAALLVVNLVVLAAGRADAQTQSVGVAAHGKCVGIASDGMRVYRAFEDGYVDVIWPKADEATLRRQKGDGKWYVVESLR